MPKVSFRQENESVSKLIKDIDIPKMFRVKQIFPNEKINRTEINAKLRKLLEKEKIYSRIKPEMKIAITASSQGIANA